MKHIILTGHSKGLGAGIAAALLNENHQIHGISRSDNSKLQKLAATHNCKIHFYPCDLSHTEAIDTVLQIIFQNIQDTPEGVYLINNAGIINPIGSLPSLPPDEMELHMRINLLAPMFLSRGFIKYTQEWNTEKRILNISSGAAVNPYFGWSTYCTAKAGLDMLTRCVDLEQDQQKYPVQIMSVAPGIIDTDMQTIIRNTTEEQFINRSKFIQLKETGQLVAPEKAGEKLAELLFSKKFKSGSLADIRDSY